MTSMEAESVATILCTSKQTRFHIDEANLREVWSPRVVTEPWLVTYTFAVGHWWSDDRCDQYPDRPNHFQTQAQIQVQSPRTGS